MKKQIYLCFNIPYTYNKSGLLFGYFLYYILKIR